MSEPNKANGANMQNTVAPAIRYGVAAIFAMIGVSGSVKLIICESSSSTSLVTLVLVSLFGLLVMFFGDQIDWFDLKNLTIKMRKVEEAHAEVKESEQLVKKLALDTLSLVEQIEKSAIMDGKFDSTAFNKTKDAIRKNST